MSAEQSTVEYRDVQDFPGYRVGNDGSVWSCRARTPIPGKTGCQSVLTNKWRRLNQYVNTNGYAVISMSLPGKRSNRSRLIHRLVLAAFVGPCPDGMECCHGDGNCLNNNLANLRWDTPKANTADTIKHGTRPVFRGERNSQAKLTEDDVQRIRAEYAAGGTLQRELGARYGLPQASISVILRRRTWKHLK